MIEFKIGQFHGGYKIMSEVISIIISILALIISSITAWFSFFHNGIIKMTQPTIVFFGPDGTSGPPKIFLRTLLFSTSKRGKIVENMYLKIQRGESFQNFNIWVYGEKDDLVRGSGLYVGKEGISCNHHFLLPKDGTKYNFLEGEYTLEVFASLLNRKKPQLLKSLKLNLPKEYANEINNEKSGVFYDWGPTQEIIIHIWIKILIKV
jgi:hypothetical protein